MFGKKSKQNSKNLKEESIDTSAKQAGCGKCCAGRRTATKNSK